MVDFNNIASNNSTQTLGKRIIIDDYDSIKPSTLGELFKVTRESLAYTTRDAANALNINTKIIEHLENDQLLKLQLPDIYLKGYMYSYAQYLKISKQVVDSYDVFSNVVPNSKVENDFSSRLDYVNDREERSTYFVVKIVTAIVLFFIVIGSVLFWLQKRSYTEQFTVNNLNDTRVKNVQNMVVENKPQQKQTIGIAKKPTSANNAQDSSFDSQLNDIQYKAYNDKDNSSDSGYANGLDTKDNNDKQSENNSFDSKFYDPDATDDIKTETQLKAEKKSNINKKSKSEKKSKTNAELQIDERKIDNQQEQPPLNLEFDNIVPQLQQQGQETDINNNGSISKAPKTKVVISKSKNRKKSKAKKSINPVNPANPATNLFN